MITQEADCLLRKYIVQYHTILRGPPEMMLSSHGSSFVGIPRTHTYVHVDSQQGDISNMHLFLSHIFGRTQISFLIYSTGPSYT